MEGFDVSRKWLAKAWPSIQDSLTTTLVSRAGVSGRPHARAWAVQLGGCMHLPRSCAALELRYRPKSARCQQMLRSVRVSVCWSSNGRSALSAACCVPAPPISLALAPAGPKSGLASVPMAAAGSLLILLYSWKPALKLPCLFSWRWLHRSTLFASNRRRFRPGETREIQPVHPVPALAQALALLMRASSRN